MIVFDEKKYAEKMIREGFLTKHKHVYELFILSKYYFSTENDIDVVKNEIVKFCKKHLDFFNIDEWHKIINKTLNYAQNSSLVTGREITITKKELDTIKSLDKLNEQKVAFIMLVLYKFYEYKKFEISIEDLYRLCKLNINSKSKLMILQSLTSKELIDITMGGKRWVKFAEKNGKDEITILNFEDFIYEYEKYIGGNFGYCECGQIFKVTNNKIKYCKPCAKEINIKKTIENRKSK